MSESTKLRVPAAAASTIGRPKPSALLTKTTARASR